MRLYTADEINALLNRFAAIKLRKNDQRMEMDYMATVQSIARLIDDFLDKYTKPQRSYFFGLFGAEDEDEK